VEGRREQGKAYLEFLVCVVFDSRLGPGGGRMRLIMGRGKKLAADYRERNEKNWMVYSEEMRARAKLTPLA
jgi:hypothetical protein